MQDIKKYLLTSVKGACMGAADVIPGVSGGTIAFIMVNNQWLLLDYEIVIPPPPPGSGSGNGGFKPSVDEWDDVQTDIII